MLERKEGLGGVHSNHSLFIANQIQGFFLEGALGVMDRLVLSDAASERMSPLIIGRPDQKGGRDNRMIVEGALWIVRTGSPWRDLPEALRDWNSVFRRFSRWSIKVFGGGSSRLMSYDPHFKYLIVDSTIVRAHQHAARGKKRSEDQALGPMSFAMALLTENRPILQDMRATSTTIPTVFAHALRRELGAVAAPV